MGACRGGKVKDLAENYRKTPMYRVRVVVAGGGGGIIIIIITDKS